MKKLVIILFLMILGTSCTSTVIKNECKSTCIMNNYTFDSFNHPMCECAEKDDPKDTIYNP